MIIRMNFLMNRLKEVKIIEDVHVTGHWFNYLAYPRGL